MPSYTPSMGLPYVLPTDTPRTFPSVSQELATILDRVGRHASGQASSSVPSAVPGYGTVAVTFPASRFTVAPVVLVSPVAATAAKGYAWPQTPTTSGVTLVWQQENGTAKATTLFWHATQTGAATAVRDVEDPGPVREVVVTCPTSGCENEGVAVTLTVAPDVAQFACGPCGADLTDSARAA